MKTIPILLVLMLCAMPLAAQPTGTDEGGRSIVKILIGGAAVAIGTAVAAKSSNSTTVTSSLGINSTTSSFSKSQLITGLSIAGVGGIILWDGLRHHDRVAPATVVGATLSPSGAAVFVRRTLAPHR